MAFIDLGLITSQFVTAPKLASLLTTELLRLITSQFVTAPKPRRFGGGVYGGLITSQFVTAPKLVAVADAHRRCLITSQFVTAPKPLGQNPFCKGMEELTDRALNFQENAGQYSVLSHVRIQCHQLCSPA